MTDKLYEMFDLKWFLVAIINYRILAFKNEYLKYSLLEFWESKKKKKIDIQKVQSTRATSRVCKKKKNNKNHTQHSRIKIEFKQMSFSFPPLCLPGDSKRQHFNFLFTK